MTEQLALPYFTVDLQSCLIIISTVKVKSLRCVRFFAIPQTVNYQAPQSMGFSRQEFWGRLSFPSPGDLPNPGIEPWSPALQADALPSEPPGKLSYNLYNKVTQLYVCVCMSVCVCTFSYSFPWWFITRHWIYFPALHSRTLLLIHPVYNRLRPLIPNSQSFPSPLPPPWQSMQHLLSQNIYFSSVSQTCALLSRIHDFF